MTNIKDIAKIADVSVMTVSRVLNNKGYVSDEKRKKVLECAKRLNYQPNMIARSLVLNRTSTVGVLLSHIENPVYAQYVASMSRVFRTHGMDIILSCASSVEDWISGVKTLLGKQVDGLVILPVELDDISDYPQAWAQACEEAGKLLRTNAKPYVVIGDSYVSDKSIRVRHDYQAGAEMAVDYLIKTGHRKIGHLRFENGGGVWAERLEGFERAMKRAGLHVRAEWIYSCGDDDVYKAMRVTLEMLDRVSELPTAICCANDKFAVGAMQALNMRGMRVPEDISLIGHDGSLYSRCTSPFLTTVSIQPLTAGTRAAEVLLDLLHERPVDRGDVFVPPNFQEGGTVRRIHTEDGGANG